MPRFRIIVMDELCEDFQHFGKSEIAMEMGARLSMLGWSVSLRDAPNHSFESKTDSKGKIIIDVLH